MREEVTFTKEEQQEILRDHNRKIDRDMIIKLEARGYMVRIRPVDMDLDQRDNEFKTILEARGYAVLPNDIDELVKILQSKGYEVKKNVNTSDK